MFENKNRVAIQYPALLGRIGQAGEIAPAVAWVNGVDEVFNSINVYEVLPSGTAKIKVPVVPVELALKPVGKFESDVGELVALPAVKRM